MAELAVLQRWMQGRIVADEAIAAAAPDWMADAVVTGSAALPADERLRIYSHGYVLRLIECLRADFPVLRALVGDTVFDLFATAYLAERPSRSPSLYDLGAGFADFLEATRPAEGAGRGTLEAIPASLARLERAIAEVSRAPGPETLAQTGAQAAMTAMLLLAPATVLRLPQSVRLLRLDFDFAQALAAAERGARPAQPPAREICVAVARSGYRVRALDLAAPRFAWLEALGQDGGDALDAARRAAAATGCDADALFAQIAGWLPTALQQGLIASG
jgi:hypothetical protein